MANLALPTNYEIQLIERQFMAALEMDDPLFKMLPIESVDATEVIWEQEANFQGLLPGRGNGDPTVVKLLGAKRYEMTPGSYGGVIYIDEKQLEEARKYGTPNMPAPETYLVTKAQDQLLNMRINRLRSNGWTLLSTGSLQVPNDLGGYTEILSYPIRTASVTAWSSLSTATPLADFRALELLHRGYSTWFDGRATVYMNTAQKNYMLNNTNANDIGGKRRDVGASIFSVEEVNKILLSQDLPQIEVMDEGYYDSTGTFQLFIPTGTVIVIGHRPSGQQIGKIQLTRNAVNDDSRPGAYTLVTDSSQTGKPVPKYIRVDDGVKGGIALHYPSSVVAMAA